MTERGEASEEASAVWVRRWREGRIGFHSDGPQPLLARYWPLIEASEAAAVLLPLCGRSGDIDWLARRGHPVLGVELVREAVEQWFERCGDAGFHLTRRPGFERFEQPAAGGRASVTLDAGNFFHLEPARTAHIGAFHDRAALVALPAAPRRRYAHHLACLLAPASVGLLIAVEHTGAHRDGPPFSVDADEIRVLFAPNFRIEHLGARRDARGLLETAWRLTRKSPCL